MKSTAAASKYGLEDQRTAPKPANPAASVSDSTGRQQEIAAMSVAREANDADTTPAACDQPRSEELPGFAVRSGIVCSLLRFLERPTHHDLGRQPTFVSAAGKRDCAARVGIEVDIKPIDADGG